MANLMLDSSGSEDELPNVAEIVRRHKSKPAPVPKLLPGGHDNKENKGNKGNKGNMTSPKPQLKPTSMSPQKVQATPLRRRKLGLAQTQAVDGSLFQPWTAKKGDAESSKGRETSLKPKASRAWLREGSAETSGTSSVDTSREYPATAMKSRPRLEIDSDEDDDPASRRPKSVRPLRLREMLARTESPSKRAPSSGSRRPRGDSGSAAAKSGAEEYDDGHSSDESDFDPNRSDSDLLATPPRRRKGISSVRRLRPLKTAASVETAIKTGGTASRSSSVIFKDDLPKDDLPKGRRGDQLPDRVRGSALKTPRATRATKGSSLEDEFDKLKM